MSSPEDFARTIGIWELAFEQDMFCLSFCKVRILYPS